MIDPSDVLREWLRESPRVLDGATGTLLESRGVNSGTPLWASQALIDCPDTVRGVHREYVDAGAEIVVANTFRTTPHALCETGIESRGGELNRLAVRLAREAAEGAARRIVIAASVAPVRDCYRPESTPDRSTLESEHARMMEWLADAHVDLVWIETMGTVREARIAAAAAARAGLPFACSFHTREDGQLLSGDALARAVIAIAEFEPVALGLNCIPPSGVSSQLDALVSGSALPVAAYAHIGNSQPTPGWCFAERASPAQYAACALSWLAQGACAIGGCCGTDPSHIRAVAGVVRAAADKAAIE